MNRRNWTLLGWTFTWLAIAASSAQAVELRGRSGTRATHRLAALQVEEEAPMEVTPEMEEAPAEEVAPSPTTPPAVRRPAASPPPRTITPMAPPAWDADVIHALPQNGPGNCSEGYCEECPTYGGCFGAYGSWGSIEYLLWWRQSRSMPRLVTTSLTATDVATDGRLGEPQTVVLLDDQRFDDHLQPGGRFDIGLWLDSCQSFGMGLRVTALGDDDLNFSTNSNANSVLTVPFFNLDSTVNAEDVLVVAHPLDNRTGSIDVIGHNEVYFGDIYGRLVGAQSDRYRVDLIGGYMFSRINDDLTLRTSSAEGVNTVTIQDRFRTKNEYHGGTIGLMGEFERGSWKVNMLAKVGLANVSQRQIIDGITTASDGTTESVTLSGLFAQTSNIGERETNEFAVIPELNITWVYKIGCRTDLSVGYSCVYWSEAALAGDQINRRVDPTQATARPAGTIVSGDYFAQGLNFGLGWSY